MSLKKSATMETTSGTIPTNVTVLHVGPQDQDLRVLNEILKNSDWQLCPGTSWKLAAGEDLSAATAAMQDQGVRIILCERECATCTWQDILQQAESFSVPPLVIVASRTADERLWAEALNLGAYDVLAKPYHPAEVIRVLSLAWLHGASRPAAMMARAS